MVQYESEEYIKGPWGVFFTGTVDSQISSWTKFIDRRHFIPGIFRLILLNWLTFSQARTELELCSKIVHKAFRRIESKQQNVISVILDWIVTQNICFLSNKTDLQLLSSWSPPSRTLRSLWSTWWRRAPSRWWRRWAVCHLSQQSV